MNPDGWNKRAAGCIGKAAFSTPQLANKVRRSRGRLRSKGKRKSQTYRCQYCGYFHIGTPVKSVHASAKRFRQFDDGDYSDMD